MSAFTNSFAGSLLASIILMSGGVAPVLAQYSCPPREIQSVHEVGDFKFELQGCQRQGKKVTCSMWVTTSKDINEYFYAASDDNITRLLDVSGTQYKASLIQGASKASSSGINISLVKDVPIKIVATFEDVPISVQDIALFEVYNIARKNGQFRNIKITESKTGNAPAPMKKKK